MEDISSVDMTPNVERYYKEEIRDLTREIDFFQDLQSGSQKPEEYDVIIDHLKAEANKALNKYKAFITRGTES